MKKSMIFSVGRKWQNLQNLHVFKRLRNRGFSWLSSSSHILTIFYSGILWRYLLILIGFKIKIKGFIFENSLKSSYPSKKCCSSSSHIFCRNLLAIILFDLWKYNIICLSSYSFGSFKTLPRWAKKIYFYWDNYLSFSRRYLVCWGVYSLIS